MLLVVTQAFHPRLQVALHQGQTAAWLIILLAGLLVALLVWPVALVLRKLPGGNSTDMARLALGQWGVILTGLLWLISIAFNGGMILRQTSEMAISAVFPHTPQTFVTTALLLGAVYVALGDGSALVRLGRLLLLPLLLAIALVLVGVVGWGEWSFLLPLWGPGPLQLLRGAPSVANIFSPLAICWLLAADVDARKGLVPWLVAAPLVSCLVLAAVKMVLGIAFAFPVGEQIPFPLHEAARLVLGGRFFERLEGVWVFVWVITTIVWLGAALYGGARAFCEAFEIPRRRTAVLPLAAAVLTLAFFPPDQATTIKWHEWADLPIFLATFLYQALLAGIALFRLRGRSA